MLTLPGYYIILIIRNWGLSCEDRWACISKGYIMNVLKIGIVCMAVLLIAGCAHNPVPYFERGRENAEKGLYDEAIANYTKAVTIDPKYSEAFLNRGAIYVRKASSDYDAAIGDLRRQSALIRRLPSLMSIEVLPIVKKVLANRLLQIIRRLLNWILKMTSTIT